LSLMGLILIFSVPTTTSTITILPILGIDWKHYKHPLQENVYDVYMQYWADVRLASDDLYAGRNLDENTLGSSVRLQKVEKEARKQHTP
jgi:hypothetical protein